MQTLKTITFFATVSNSASSRTSKTGRTYTAVGVFHPLRRPPQTFHYNVVASASRAMCPTDYQQSGPSCLWVDLIVEMEG